MLDLFGPSCVIEVSHNHNKRHGWPPVQAILSGSVLNLCIQTGIYSAGVGSQDEIKALIPICGHISLAQCANLRVGVCTCEKYKS
jgi:hypothetical protein